MITIKEVDDYKCEIQTLKNYRVFKNTLLGILFLLLFKDITNISFGEKKKSYMQKNKYKLKVLGDGNFFLNLAYDLS